RHLRPQPRLHSNLAGARSDLAQHALRRDRTSPAAAGDPHSRSGVHQPAPRCIARRAAAGDAKFYPGLAAADRAHRGNDPDLCGWLRRLPAPGDPRVTTVDQQKTPRTRTGLIAYDPTPAQPGYTLF